MTQPWAWAGRSRSRNRRYGLATFAVTAALASGCGRSDRGTSGPMTQMQADDTVQRAIRSSNEGVILMPSKKAEQVYELPRLNEIAQNLRGPAAVCFLQRALQTMEAEPGSDLGWTGVPDGQVKLRARINPGGKVLATEILESGFSEDHVPLCVAEAVERTKWPENTGGNNHYIDIVYWVSLGMQPRRAAEQFADRLRLEQARAAVRAKACLEGRVEPGSYTVEGLNLIGRDGATIANRIDQTAMAEPVRQCLAQAFKAIRLPAESESFLRPVSPSVRFDIEPDGTIRAADEDWLRLVLLEERAKKAELRRELSGETAAGERAPSSGARVDGAAIPGGDASQQDVPPDVTLTEAADAGSGDATEAPAPAPEPKPRKLDPRQGGIKIDLSPSRDEEP